MRSAYIRGRLPGEEQGRRWEGEGGARGPRLVCAWTAHNSLTTTHTEVLYFRIQSISYLRDCSLLFIYNALAIVYLARYFNVRVFMDK
jgi:hypothetical protein